MSYEDMLAPNSILNKLKIAVIPEGAAGNHTVTGIKTTDRILAVWQVILALGEAAPPTITTTAADLTGEFTITALNTINNGGGTALTDSWGIVFYLVDGA